jgi:hypothetical protein
MSIDLESEEALTLKAATKLPILRRNGRHPHVSQLYRWATTGLRGGIRLETVKIGGSLCTTREAVLRFIARLTNPDTPVSAPTPARRQREVAAAEKQLEAAGL